ncbi:Succinyl-CoA ligase, subunit beta [Komagataella phaffii CBS 7435]|uniref:Succinate--CoA ligase [ADP-forming] subunit beta, mitochondrial n=2 Tax=Komagataella phaffii TaxID=460519 RepID=C4R1X8_KOMPG|nr:Beta subunit of succinyl-CoA ligase, which is a mitochondrial enzyme of the TCA cycle [Komagataella phaffii GS115]AOA62900.1 GQ67_00922T0 [Komagataella phaffii]CAH2447956.1 Succinyl-CoA ligase, subunit beta [Komagataella phaffii CBS 7435]AOA68021.1 GQ68_00467T0 [Komagataella phaffii GS115]CAY69502.1 Beta subunit of succinyl-CoA ligase, which is a mitochondrial enzyme of the TCA cycle [Komagataella phaffii GS115]CCA38117.1 Succinyl-CoA ligase, subunit beta [Komagataella phaffii CBS 7435]
MYRLFNRSVIRPFAQQRRCLSIHEYRSADLLRAYDVPVPRGGAADSPEEAYKIAQNLHSDGLVIKAQALTGGRGKGHFDSGLQGGVKLVSTPEEVRDLAGQMLQHNLITKQSGAAGKLVSAVYVVERKDAVHEAYLAILVDRVSQKPAIVVSSQGGMDIEGVAAKDPSAIKTFPIDLKTGVTDSLAAEIASNLGFSPEAQVNAQDSIKKLYQIFMEKDATQIEINPLSEVSGNEVLCMDAKFGFDDSALFRHSDVESWRDPTQEDADEVEAGKWGLNFIKLDGNIGCLVNGAGLAMATMDIIKLYGGEPANFLDCGGGATPESIEKAFRLILTEDKVKGIFVNIFGGIVRCDYVAQGLIAATKSLDLSIPVVVRLNGTNLSQAEKLIEESGLKLYSFKDLDPAAEKIVELTK